MVYTKPGPSPYLTNVEETELANFLVDVPKVGHKKSRGINNNYNYYTFHIITIDCLKIQCWNGIKLFTTKKCFYVRKDVETPSGREHQFLALSQ